MIKSWYFLMLLFLAALGTSVWKIVTMDSIQFAPIFFSFMIGWTLAFISILISNRKAWKKAKPLEEKDDAVHQTGKTPVP